MDRRRSKEGNLETFFNLFGRIGRDISSLANKGTADHGPRKEDYCNQLMRSGT